MVMEWLKNLVGVGDVTVENKAGLPHEGVELLRKDFERLEPERAGIAVRLLRYVLDGEGAEVLAELGRVPKASSLLGMLCHAESFVPLKGDSPRRGFFADVVCDDPGLLLRLARVFDVASLTESRRTYLGFWEKHGLSWMEVFLREAVQMHLYSFPPEARVRPTFGVETLEEMLRRADRDPALLVRGALAGRAVAGQQWKDLSLMFVALKGMGEGCVRYPEAVREALAQTDFEARTYSLDLLRGLAVPLAPFAERVTKLAVGPARKVRGAAEAWLKYDLAAVRPRLEELTANGEAEERPRAAALLWRLFGEESRPFLETRLAKEKGRKALATLGELLVKPEPDQLGKPTVEAEFSLPSVPPVDLHTPLGEPVREALRHCVAEYNRLVEESFANWLAANRDWARQHPAMAARNPFALAHIESERDHARRLTPADAEEAFLLLQGSGADVGARPKPLVSKDNGRFHEDRRAFFAFVETPGLKLVHVVRLLPLLGLTDGAQDCWESERLLTHFRQHHGLNFDVREVAATMRSVGQNDAHWANHLLDGRTFYGGSIAWRWGGVWELFADRWHLLRDRLVNDANGRSSDAWDRHHALSILAMFPRPPAPLRPLLWELALKGTKADRTDAQPCLANVPDRLARITAALAAGQGETRAVAADWLGRLDDLAALPALRAALKKETRDVPKAAMMDALAALGVSADEFLDRAGLAQEAAKGLAKGLPADLAWFPFAALPAVRWADTGEAVSPEVVRWLVVQACRLKNPEPNALLRRYAGSFEKTGREALGRFVLTAWIAQDTIPTHTPAEAAMLADAQVQQQWASVAKYLPDTTPEQWRNALYQGYLKAVKGSAIGQKGILAVAGACAGADIVPNVAAYLKEWYGLRANQCRSLVQMLAWVDHPAAIQLLLSFGNRFRTKSIQEEAARQVQALAERRGWTLAELTDRTAPTAGFDENGALELPYGDARTFTARLGEEFAVGLFNADGRAITALPEPNAADDPERAKASKAALSAARKELKAAVRGQTERLYEAMCVGRAWRFADWDVYLNRHPIVGRLGQRLVWAVFAEGKLARTFRPLADRTLTDPADDAVELPADAEIRLAHGTFLSAADAAAWRTHLADYAVESLFAQFGEAAYTLPADAREQTESTDFRGHLVEAFRLRGRATKLGYVRGQTEDGGWFYSYRKNFAALGLEAVVEFTGNGLPEENRTVALRGLSFARGADPAVRHDFGGGNGGGVPLGEVPPVLLSECWSDLRRIAAEGPGFDPDWEKKTGP